MSTTPLPYSHFVLQFDDMAEQVHQLAKTNGFWDEDRNVGEMIALIHSELSEGLEGHRRRTEDDHLPGRSSLEVELADAIIRIMDLAVGLGLDVGTAIVQKHVFNRSRPYRHGKAY